MAYRSTLLVSLLFAVANMPSAFGLLLDGEIASVNVTGLLYCSVDGNLPNSTVPNLLAGAPVELRCGPVSSSNILNSTTTDLTGRYTFVVSLVQALLFNLSSCYVQVNLPLVSCTVLPATGILTAPLTILNVVENVLTYLVGPFTRILPA